MSDSEKDRADDNFKSYERVKELYSAAVKDLEAERARILEQCSVCGCAGIAEPDHDYCQSCARSGFRQAAVKLREVLVDLTNARTIEADHPAIAELAHERAVDTAIATAWLLDTQKQAAPQLTWKDMSLEYEEWHLNCEHGGMIGHTYANANGHFYAHRARAAFKTMDEARAAENVAARAWLASGGKEQE